jgi:HlyD family secretion protein
VVRRAVDVLVLPERVVEFRGDTALVRLPAAPKASPEERRVQVGMSDGISVELKDGLQLGDRVLEKDVKEIK